MALIRFGPLISPIELARRNARYARELLKEQRAEQQAFKRYAFARGKQIAREFRASERARKQELAVFKRLARRQGIKVKPLGHGLRKQVKQYRPQITELQTRERHVRQARKVVSVREFQSIKDAYAAKLNAAYGKPGRAAVVENPGDIFLSLPRRRQLAILRQAEIHHSEYVAGGEKPFGLQYDPLMAYH